MEWFTSLSLFGLVLVVPALRRLYLLEVKPHNNNDTVVKRVEFFDFAKGVAILAVILIHATYLYGNVYQNGEEVYFFLNNNSRFAVGFFFISSGVLLREGVNRRKVINVLIPYLVFCIAIGIAKKLSIGELLFGTLRGDILVPYYFIPVLFQFYLLFPLLFKLSRYKGFLQATLAISLVSYFLPQTWNLFKIPTFAPYLYLFAFGMVYSEKLIQNKINTVQWLVVIIIFYIILQFIFPSRYYNSRFFYAPAVFFILHQLWHGTQAKQKKGLLIILKYLQTIGKLSIWIFLCHFVIEEWVFKFMQASPLKIPPVIFIFYLFLTTSLISIIFSYLLSKSFNFAIRNSLKSI